MTQIIDTTDIPASDGSTDTGPEFAYAAPFYGRDIEQTVYRFIRDTLPRLRDDGQVKDYTGVGAAVYLPGATDFDAPWLSFTLDASLEPAGDRTRANFSPAAVVYQENARRKAKFTIRTGLDSSAAVTTHRHLRQPGDFHYAGAVLVKAVIVTISGFTQEQDEMFARLLADYVIAQMMLAVDAVADENRQLGDHAAHFWCGALSKADLLEAIENGSPLDEV